MKHLKLLEKITGHAFQNLAYLQRALTHSSAQIASGEDYERLEFLGDRVLGLVIADMLCRLFPKAPEGELSVRLNALVNAQTCAEIAYEIGLPDLIRTGADVRSLSEKHQRNIHADVIEALIAVLYIDGGLQAAEHFIHKYWEPRAHRALETQRDPKTQLQEWAHQQNGAQPVYRTVSRKGPDHDPLFCVEVIISGFAPVRAEGRSKRLAEQNAAQTLLQREGIR